MKRRTKKTHLCRFYIYWLLMRTHTHSHNTNKKNNRPYLIRWSINRTALMSYGEFQTRAIIAAKKAYLFIFDMMYCTVVERVSLTFTLCTFTYIYIHLCDGSWIQQANKHTHSITAIVVTTVRLVWWLWLNVCLVNPRSFNSTARPAISVLLTYVKFMYLIMKLLISRDRRTFLHSNQS